MFLSITVWLGDSVIFCEVIAPFTYFSFFFPPLHSAVSSKTKIEKTNKKKNHLSTFCDYSLFTVQTSFPVF